MPEERKQFVDIAKGLTILLVVVEHNPFIYQYHVTTQAIILSFHMPLFYFVSGIFFSRHEELKVITQKRFHSLLKPYFTACLLFFLLKSVKDFQVAGTVPFIRGVLYGTSNSLSWPYQPLWFLTSLFVTVIFCRILYFSLNRINRKWLRVSGIFLFLVAGVFFIKQKTLYPHGGLPWNIDLLGITAFFYALGFEGRRWLFRIHDKKILGWSIVFLLLFFVVLHWYFTVLPSDPDTINLTLRHYDNLLVNSFEAVSGILLVIFLSISLSEYSKRLTLIFSYVGRCSLTIFIFHELFMLYLGDVGRIFLRVDSFVLFVFSVLLTIGFTLITHEIVIRVPIVGFFLLNKRIGRIL